MTIKVSWFIAVRFFMGTFEIVRLPNSGEQYLKNRITEACRLISRENFQNKNLTRIWKQNLFLYGEKWWTFKKWIMNKKTNCIRSSFLSLFVSLSPPPSVLYPLPLPLPFSFSLSPSSFFSHTYTRARTHNVHTRHVRILTFSNISFSKKNIKKNKSQRVLNANLSALSNSAMKNTPFYLRKKVDLKITL